MESNGARRITLKDIARETGYTVNTVSRALMGMSDISSATTEKIRLKADEMGYVRNHMASALRSGSTHTIALIVGHMTNPFFASVFDNVEKAATARGYTVMLLSSHEKSDREMNAIQTAISHNVDGLILFPCQENEDCLQLLRSSGIPFVILCREFLNQPADYVLWQEEEGGYLAARHLMEMGHRKLIYVYDTNLIYSINQRREGFLRACREAGIPENDIRIISNVDESGQDNASGTAERIAGLYRLGFDGVVAFCDMVALRLIANLRVLKLRVPDDISFIGFDNTDQYAPTSTPLCSVDGHCEAISEAAVTLLDRRIKRETFGPQKLFFPMEVICRESCHRGEACGS